MARRDAGRSGLLAVLSMVLLELGAAACGGQTGEDGGAGAVTVTGGAPQAGEASAAGGDAGAAGVAPASGGSGGVDCTLVGCGLTWCGEECESPCGCCPCLGGSEDAAGNRCADGCWLRTAGDVHCQEPWDAGPCDAEVPVFWFDAATNRCEPRTYGGCEGNANRFDTLVSCEQDCAVVRGPGSAPLPVVYAFGDRCDGDALSADGRRIVAEFVVDQPHDPPGDDPFVLVDLMAGNALCARMSDVVLNGVGVEAFVDYVEYGERGYLPVHEAEVPVAAITLDLGELSAALGVEPPAVEWR